MVKVNGYTSVETTVVFILSLLGSTLKEKNLLLRTDLRKNMVRISKRLWRDRVCHDVSLYQGFFFVVVFLFFDKRLFGLRIMRYTQWVYSLICLCLTKREKKVKG